MHKAKQQEILKQSIADERAACSISNTKAVFSGMVMCLFAFQMSEDDCSAFKGSLAQSHLLILSVEWFMNIKTSKVKSTCEAYKCNLLTQLKSAAMFFLFFNQTIC